MNVEGISKWANDWTIMCLRWHTGYPENASIVIQRCCRGGGWDWDLACSRPVNNMEWFANVLDRDAAQACRCDRNLRSGPQTNGRIVDSKRRCHLIASSIPSSLYEGMRAKSPFDVGMIAWMEICLGRFCGIV